ncbi:MAG: dihydroorotase [Oscillospiraceae bacterium]
MKKLIKNARVYTEGMFKKLDILIDGGVIAEMSRFIKTDARFDGVVFDFNRCHVLPGLSDVHVHLREPGFSYKETIKTGTQAASRGGFTSVCAMPNLSPVPDSLDHLQAELDAIARDAVVHVYPYGAITAGEKGEILSDMAAMAPYVKGFSDDGRGVQSADMMRRAMLAARQTNRPIVSHCEVEALLNGGCVHDGEYAEAHGLRGIPSESEWRQIERDISLLRETGASYHLCHMSTKEGVSLVRNAKAEGLDITCETAAHYLLMCDTDIGDDGRFKMNPPIRAKDDRNALVQGIMDGTVDMIITDHAPHSAEEKSGGLQKSIMGVVGLETSFAACYTGLVRTDRIRLEKLVDLMHGAPKRRFGIGTDLAVGEPANLAVFDLEQSYTVDPSEFLSMGRATPFAGKRLYGRCLMTIVDGKIVWKEGKK